MGGGRVQSVCGAHGVIAGCRSVLVLPARGQGNGIRDDGSWWLGDSCCFCRQLPSA